MAASLADQKVYRWAGLKVAQKVGQTVGLKADQMVALKVGYWVDLLGRTMVVNLVGRSVAMMVVH